MNPRLIITAQMIGTDANIPVRDLKRQFICLFKCLFSVFKILEIEDYRRYDQGCDHIIGDRKLIGSFGNESLQDKCNKIPGQDEGRHMKQISE